MTTSTRLRLGILVALVALLVARVWYALSIGIQSPNQDELALLMNARFLWLTGKDEWGFSWPVVLTSFGDAKLVGYVLAALPFGVLSGWQWWAVRLPSLLAGVLLPFVVGWFTSRVFRSVQAGWWTALLLVSSPWTWHYGTLGYEAHLSLAVLFTSFTLLLGKSRKEYFLALCGIFFAGITYNTPLILAPWIILWAGATGSRWSWQERGMRMFGVLLVVAVFATLTLSASSQKTGVALWSNATFLSEYPAYRQAFSSPLAQTLLGNQWVYLGRGLAQRWVQSWSWEFVVLRGGTNPWHAIPQTGHLSFVVPLLAALGLGGVLAQALCAIWQRRFGFETISIWLWLSGGVVFLLPALLTIDAPHATRSLAFFVWLTVLAGVAAERMVRISQFSRLILTIGIVSAFMLWWLPAQGRWQQGASERWERGLLPALQAVPESKRANLVVVDENGTLYPYVVQAYMFTPSLFWDTVERSAPDTVGLRRVQRVAKVHFVLHPEDAPPGSLVLQKNNSLNWIMMESL